MVAEAPAKSESYFRGYWSILEVKGRVERLTDWLKANRPSCKQVTLKGPDYDLVRRWPKAAGLHGFIVTDDGAVYDGFSLLRDKKPRRYEK